MAGQDVPIVPWSSAASIGRISVACADRRPCQDVLRGRLLKAEIETLLDDAFADHWNSVSMVLKASGDTNNDGFVTYMFT